MKKTNYKYKSVKDNQDCKIVFTFCHQITKNCWNNIDTIQCISYKREVSERGKLTRCPFVWSVYCGNEKEKLGLAKITDPEITFQFS